MTSIAEQQEDRAVTEAGAWLARLQRDDVGEDDGLAFEAWLAAAPANRSAYVQSLGVWHEYAAGAEEVTAELARQADRPRPLSRRWVTGIGGLAIAAGLAIAILPGVLSQTASQSFVTGKGQHQRVRLEDGSVIDLNAETRLKVSFVRSERKVVMAEGEAIFDVAPDKARPFTVAAAGRTVRVVGTQFDVRSRQGELTVTVARGKVEVRPGVATGHDYLLTPGQRLAVGATGVEDLRVVDPQEAFGWRIGRLVYRNQALSVVVADLNRQFVEQTEIGDPELGAIPITGVIVLDDPRAVMARLSLMLPIRSVPSDRGLLLLKK